MRAHIALEDVLLVFEDGDTRTRLEGYRPECLVVDPTDPATVFCGTFDAGLQRSLDGGDRFSRVGAEALPEVITALAVAPDDPDGLWIGTEPSRVFYSPDAGGTFEPRPGLTELPSATEWSFPPRPDTHHVRWIEPDAADPERLYVGIEAGALVRSHDRGRSWVDRVPSGRIDTHTVVTHPDAPGRAWSAAGDGYAETHDSGVTWQHPQDGLDHRYCWSVAVDPVDPERVLLSAASGPGRAHRAANAESHLYRRHGEEPWERLTETTIPTGEGVLRTVLEAGGDGECYAANNHGLYRTPDFGTSWERLPVEWTESYESQTVRGVAVVGT